MSSSKEIFKYVSFFVCCILLFVFILVESAHEYEYMLNEVGYDLTSWCQLPMEKDHIRREMYMVFLALFGVVGFVFLREKKLAFIACMLIIFCYATYSFLLRDMACGVP